MVQPLAAQGPEARREQLRQQVMERFMINLRTEAGLTDDAMRQVQAVLRRSMEARGQLAQREMATWRALEAQMRPGVAADADSVEVLLARLVSLHERRGQLANTDQVALAEFLAPVQRAQVTMAFRRLQMRIDQIRGNRGPPGGMR
jgi:glutamyl/glutaminyl-tRNA synthetase